MTEQVTVKRTTGSNPDFKQLISQLDNELWNELKEDQVTYDQYNKVPGINTALVVYENGEPVAIGCFKKYNDNTIEIKRMFVVKEHRGKKHSKRVLGELEKWAMRRGFKYAILETSIHFVAARSLYKNAGYAVIENYDQYKGLEESVCMKKELVAIAQPSEFRQLPGLEYFDFEEDFVELNMRCIPMIVRFKMDAAGIKLKLVEWSKFKKEERIELALKPCSTLDQAKEYNSYLAGLIKKYTNNEATFLAINQHPEWAELKTIPEILQRKIKKLGMTISTEQWKVLTDLQRFALLKLCKDGHEHKNFPKAMKEFKLVEEIEK
jgi:hypothetical protein